MIESNRVAAARRLIKSARTADELRQAQAVLLPLDLNLTMAQTGQAIGRTVHVVSTLRHTFGKAARSSRPRTPEDPALVHERLLLEGVLHDTAATGALSIARIKPALEAKRGAPMALSTVYRVLARHGWRKNAPFPAALFTKG